MAERVSLSRLRSMIDAGSSGAPIAPAAPHDLGRAVDLDDGRRVRCLPNWRVLDLIGPCFHAGDVIPNSVLARAEAQVGPHAWRVEHGRATNLIAVSFTITIAPSSWAHPYFVQVPGRGGPRAHLGPKTRATRLDPGDTFLAPAGSLEFTA